MGNHRSGHYCWCCDRHRPDETFSGSGHSRHICRRCESLPEEEREFRRAVRDIEQLVHTDEFGESHVPEKHREEFDSYKEHSNERVREFARKIGGSDAPDSSSPSESAPTPESSSEEWVWDPMKGAVVPQSEAAFTHAHSSGGSSADSDEGEGDDSDEGDSRKATGSDDTSIPF